MRVFLNQVRFWDLGERMRFPLFVAAPCVRVASGLPGELLAASYLNVGIPNASRNPSEGGKMKIVSENFRNLGALYVNQLRVMLSAAEQFVRAMPDMANAATDQELHDALWSHYRETDVHVKRLEELLANGKNIDPSVSSTSPIRCKGADGLIGEMEDMLEDARDAFVRDATLIAAAQRIEHYEIAAYGTLRQFAWVLGLTADVEILDKNAKEAGNADHVLTKIADRINENAKHGAHAASLHDTTAA